MGGYNSGRSGGRPTVESGLTIDIARMLRKGWIQEGCWSAGSLTWSRHGERFAAVGYSYDMADPDAAWLKLNYTRTPYGREPERVEQRIALTSTRPNFGGRRWWMICPYSGRRVGKLHLPPGGDRFASRVAWRLGYHSQRVAHRDRPFEKLFRLQRKLGSYEGWEAGLRRPKGMWRRTYERHFERYLELDELCAAEMAMFVLRRGGRL
jgi:hypothetical protein